MRNDSAQAPKDRKLTWFSLLGADSEWLTFAQFIQRIELAGFTEVI